MHVAEPGSGFRVFDHTADLGIELWAPTLESLLATAVTALGQCIGTPTGDTPAFCALTADGIDHEDLLVRVLGEALAAFELEGCWTNRVVTCHVERGLDDVFVARLACEGVAVDRRHEHALVEIKAVTYHGLTVEERADGWFARVIFDL